MVGLQKIFNGDIDHDESERIPVKTFKSQLIKQFVQKESASFFMEDFRLYSHLITLDELKLSRTFQIFKFQDSQYAGETCDGMRHGRGVMVYIGGRRYEGMWERDLREGKGFELFANGHTYEGEYHRGKPHGKGTYRWNKNEVYEGQWY